MRLTITYHQFSEKELAAWKGRYELVAHCYRPLKRILRKKARARPGRRFFGEAFVAARTKHKAGWYGSFKWLTSAKWSGSNRLKNSYETRFRRALQDHFPQLVTFKQTAGEAARKIRGRKPVGPDLWFVTPGRHRFIEVKLPGDRMARHQLLGLALIAKHLKADRPITVELAILESGSSRRNLEEARRLKLKFEKLYSRLGRAS